MSRFIDRRRLGCLPSAAYSGSNRGYSARYCSALSGKAFGSLPDVAKGGRTRAQRGRGLPDADLSIGIIACMTPIAPIPDHAHAMRHWPVQCRPLSIKSCCFAIAAPDCRRRLGIQLTDRRAESHAGNFSLAWAIALLTPFSLRSRLLRMARAIMSSSVGL